MASHWSTFIFKIIWLIGLFALVFIGYHYEQIVKENTAITFNMMAEFWFSSSVPFLFGIYFSLLFVKKWSCKVNMPLLLCISIPCLILTFYSPVVYTIVATTTSSPSSFSVPIPFWLYKVNYFGIVPIVAGFTLITGLFGATPHPRN